ncbi:YeeE/YedE thiosulfate transporter family protein [Neolewinella persica]|uniref:YeeE/YedE thiosulfate transporter family protein n=1 Tax=Neolewinella persica TaxID=70998 RepID=UPI0003A12D25|nr:YeeE/YedE thiosulfate transporter family protein [Neolewinella persica]
MRTAFYLLLGVAFGIVMTKSEAVSWFRIQEMFRFESFHMYGIIGTAVVTGAIGVFLSKKLGWKTIDGGAWQLNPKDFTVPRYIFGGTIFGLGWAMTGACPGPMFTLLGQGIWAIGLVILASVFGTYVYGILRSRLPH